MIDPDCGGKTKLTADDYIEGAPELLAKISASNVSIDLGDKKTAYQRNDVLWFGEFRNNRLIGFI